MFGFAKSRAVGAGVLALALVLLISFSSQPTPPGGEGGPGARNRYIGAKACKNCHDSKAKGETYSIWEKNAHANAFRVLASEQAKKVAAERGIDDPQKSDECLSCHVTGHGLDKQELKRGFEIEMGVQCETCHGPGEEHAKARFKAASAGDADPDALIDIPDDEIIATPEPATCLKCHNEKSPTFKPFCFKERRETIAHLDPRKKRSEEDLEAMKCQCEECSCKQAECGGHGAGDAGDKDKK